MFAARAGLRTLVIDADKGFTRRATLYNHLGFPEGITRAGATSSSPARSRRLAESAGVATKRGSEPRNSSLIDLVADGRTSVVHAWAAGTAVDVSVHTVITAGNGARVAINIISEQRGERQVDHDWIPAPAT